MNNTTVEVKMLECEKVNVGHCNVKQFLENIANLFISKS
jgi:hypothetical protein